MIEATATMKPRMFGLSLGMLATAALLSLGLALSAQTTAPPASIRHFPAPLSGNLPYDVDPAILGKLFPKDSNEPLTDGQIAAGHAEFDILAWQAFVALNWPAEPDGEPVRSQTIGSADTSAPRVWEYWRPSATIFLPDGAQPLPWDNKLQQTGGFYWKAAWRQHTTAASNLQAFSGPLVDQNGEWARYQIRVNREEFDYIFTNELYSQDGQVAFAQKKHQQVDLPMNEGTSRHGAIEIKLAWKELGPGDDEKRFFTRDLTADLSEPPGSDGKVPQRTFKAGLVGMHISMRTRSAPEWVWATFEQIDNARRNKEADGSYSHPNFYNPDKPMPPNVLPTANAVQDPDTHQLKIVTDNSVVPDKWAESLTTTPVQVQRVDVPTQLGLNPYDKKLHKVTEAINREVQALLTADHNSVFQYYELIDAQWPIHPNAPAMAGGAGSAPESITHKTPGDVVPVFLVNTTMETYFQKGSQPAGSLEQDDRLAANSSPIDATIVNGTESCVGCHYSAGITIGFKTDLKTGKEIVDKNGVPVPVYGENNHFGKTGNASFSWMLQQEPEAKRVDIHSSGVIVQGRN
jgi:hypothetical protein